MITFLTALARHKPLETTLGGVPVLELHLERLRPDFLLTDCREIRRWAISASLPCVENGEITTWSTLDRITAAFDSPELVRRPLDWEHLICSIDCGAIDIDQAAIDRLRETARWEDPEVAAFVLTCPWEPAKEDQATDNPLPRCASRATGEALYFTRSSLAGSYPLAGLILYRPLAIRHAKRWKWSHLADLERIDPLRLLEAGLRVQTVRWNLPLRRV